MLPRNDMEHCWFCKSRWWKRHLKELVHEYHCGEQWTPAGGFRGSCKFAKEQSKQLAYALKD